MTNPWHKLRFHKCTHVKPDILARLDEVSRQPKYRETGHTCRSHQPAKSALTAQIAAKHAVLP